MGFGFNLVFKFIIIPVLGILLLGLLFSRKKIFWQVIKVIVLGIFGLIAISSILQIFISKKVLDKDDYYGDYIIDKSYFPGKQSKWQYDHFRFNIKDNDSVLFYVTDKAKIQHIYRGTISTVKPYGSARLNLNMQQPTHHVVTTNPTIYRSTWGFILVFNSSKFGNMFFTKGNWEDK